LAGEPSDKMSMVLNISAESGLLRVGATGKFSLVQAKRTFIETLEAVARNKVEKVLFDGRGLAGNPKIIERFFRLASELSRGMLSITTKEEANYEIQHKSNGRLGRGP
jgi:hypothetical protein